MTLSYAITLELAVIGRQRRRRDAPDERFGAHPVLDQIRDRDHQQLVPLRELRQLRHPRHRPVVVHDLADDAGGIQPGDAREVDGGLGLAGAHEHAAVARLAAGTCGRVAPGRPAGSTDRSPSARSRRDRSPRCRCSSRPWPRSTRRTRCRSARCSAGPSAAGRARPAAPRSSACRSGRGRTSP